MKKIKAKKFAYKKVFLFLLDKKNCYANMYKICWVDKKTCFRHFLRTEEQLQSTTNFSLQSE